MNAIKSGTNTVVALMSLASHCSSGPSSYTVVGSLPAAANLTEICSINNAGRMVGRFANTSGLPFYCAYSQNLGGLPVLLDNTPAYRDFTANCVNENGTVAGSVRTSDGSNRAAVWPDNSIPATLGSLDGYEAVSAESINNADVVVGICENASGSTRAFRWDAAGGLQLLQNPPGCAGAEALAVNNAGMIVGMAVNEDGSYLPCVWINSGSVPEVLPVPSGWEGGTAQALNDRGQVVGRFYSSQNDFLPFVWDSSAGMQILPMSQGYSRGCALAINEKGTVVGRAKNSDLADRAVMWEGGAMYDLNSHLVGTTLWTLEYATDIDDWGGVVGFGPKKPHPNGYGVYQSFALVPSWSMGTVKSAPDNTYVGLQSVVVSASFADCFYVESDNRAGGIRVVTGGTVPAYDTRVSLSGRVVTDSNGEKTIQASVVTGAGSGHVGPLGMINRNLGGDALGSPQTGLNNVGLLVKTSGKFTYVNDGCFTISDGSGKAVKCVVPAGVGINSGWRYVAVTGISSCEKDDDGTHSVPKVRFPGDIQPIR